jgi:hypothetical protein
VSYFLIAAMFFLIGSMYGRWSENKLWSESTKRNEVVVEEGGGCHTTTGGVEYDLDPPC